MAEEDGTLNTRLPEPHSPAPVLFITQELLPFHATGGMAVLSRDLPEALIRRGWPHCYLLPYVAGVTDAPRDILRQPLYEGSVRVDDTDYGYRIFRLARPAGQGDVFLVAQDSIFNGRLYDDRFRLERNLVMADAACALLDRHRPDVRIVHALDQLSALSLACIRTATGNRFGLIFNILSAEYDFPLGDLVNQRRFHSRDALVRAFGSSLAGGSAIELGLRSADQSVTSSPAYCHYILERYALALEGSEDRIVGIAQGIDTAIWDPMAEGRLFHPVRHDRIEQDKLANRRILSSLLADLPRFSQTAPRHAPHSIAQQDAGSAILLSFVGRFCRAKGRAALYQLIDRLPALPDVEVLLVIPKGSMSDADLENLRARTASARQLRVIACYDQALAELVFAASDYVLMPSEQEPGGLCQKMAMRFGALPIVTPAGGLKSSVTDLFALPDTGNGFVCDAIDADSYLERLLQVLVLPKSSTLIASGRANAMATDVSWEPTIAAYEHVYRKAIAPERPTG